MFGKRTRPKQFLYTPTFYKPEENEFSTSKVKRIRFYRQASSKGLGRSIIWIILAILIVLFILIKLSDLSENGKWDVDTIRAAMIYTDKVIDELKEPYWRNMSNSLHNIYYASYWQSEELYHNFIPHLHISVEIMAVPSCFYS